MNYVKYFIKYVELNTKVASVFPFLIASAYYYQFYAAQYGFNLFNIVIFFVAMLCFDMATTSINHVAGIKKETDISKYDESIIKDMNELNLTMKHNYLITIALVLIATLLGLLLVYFSNIGVLLLGMLCFLIGFLYSYGPKPISYTPLGEIFSGGVMGIIIPVIVIFSQFTYLPWQLDPKLIIVFFPLAFLIGSILLANNICDLEKDQANQRYTLVSYIGQKNGVYALYLAVVGALLAIIIAVIFNYLQVYSLLLLLLIIPLFRNIKTFSKKLSKSESFPLIVMNFIVFSFVYFVILIIFN